MSTQTLQPTIAFTAHLMLLHSFCLRKDSLDYDDIDLLDELPHYTTSIFDKFCNTMISEFTKNDLETLEYKFEQIITSLEMELETGGIEGDGEDDCFDFKPYTEQEIEDFNSTLNIAKSWYMLFSTAVGEKEFNTGFESLCQTLREGREKLETIKKELQNK